jgi:3-oxoacyl-[acyl-carrier protein] reductase
VDLPAAGELLVGVANRCGGEALQLDVTADDAGERLTGFLAERHGGVDVVVHNAGTTRDKTLAGMDAERWEFILDLNFASQQRLNAALLEQRTLRAGGRIVGLASLAGIAGNRGQTNYATSKAGVIGLAEALAPHVAEQRATINAVAPGFIETRLTEAMPLGVREVGRRLNSLSQGGLPVDVAEAVAWLAGPGTGGVNGQVVRVCGQSVPGA